MKRAWLAPVAALAGLQVAGFALVGCNAVLGIQPATLDEDAAVGAEAGVGSDGSAGESGPGGGDAATEGGDPLTCANYCSIVMQNCTGVHQEYLSNDVCLALCKYMQPGTFYPAASEPDNVDTLGCRLWHAGVAATDPTVHCRHAGPLGSDLCGGPCEPFCSLDWHFCTDDNGINVYSGQVTGCESVCGQDAGIAYVEDSGDLTDPAGNMIETGNTLNCRLWHLETAISVGLPLAHRPHTGLVSATCQ